MATGIDALTKRQREAYDDLKRAGWLGIGNGYARRTLDALVTAGLAAWRYNDGAQLTIGGPDSTCGSCGREWHSRSLPTPAGRCPWEHEHDHRDPASLGYERTRRDQARDVLAAYVPWADSSERRDAQALRVSAPESYTAGDYVAAQTRYLDKAERAIAAALAVLS